ncbi:excisionase [Amycolatopsis sp. WAC 01416]|uniref:helix-turn-helix transcriptional regulator n=1 Tax=Amycolatopsis sp. WAC 01416 TaxID=2203196 RepID=UPI000F78C297|nr:helix-turn-helix domain-containing protein [Amycolatopsis sp. WAC 01416]RSN32240.1 excisionase [Amycolatopsis sp. WAC 01416]
MGQDHAFMRRLLSITEVCEEMDVAPSTFYEWRATNRAPKCLKLPNGAVRIRRSDFETWLAEREVAA